MQLDLLEDPTAWPVVPNAGGWRKARFAPPSWGKGKSGAVRAYYADLTAHGRIYLATAFSKAEMADIPGGEKRRMAELLTAIRRRLEGVT